MVDKWQMDGSRWMSVLFEGSKKKEKKRACEWVLYVSGGPQ